MGFSITSKNLSELEEGKDIVEIEVRVIRKWKNEIRNSKGCFYIDLVLLDSQNVTIQATVNKKIWKKYDEGLIEGMSYKISRFIVSTNESYQEMATTNSKRIWFNYTTKLTVVELPSIPLNKFSFSSFNDILHLNVNHHYFTDIVGEFVNYDPIYVTKDNKEWTIIHLKDIEGTELSCSIWAPYTNQVKDIIRGHMGSTDRPILVLQFVRPSIFNENVTTTTTRGATRILVNPDLPEVVALQARRVDLGNRGKNSQLTESSPEESLLSKKANIKSLEQISNGEKAGEFVTKVTFVNIDSNVPWYYNSCISKKCRSKANLESNGMWYCTNKKYCIGQTEVMKSAIARFQVKFMVMGDDNVFAEVMMFDNHINKLVKEYAAYLASKQEKMGGKDIIPLELEAFMDKEAIVKLKVSRQYNIECKSTRYTVSSITFDSDVITKWTEMFHILEKGKEVAEELTESCNEEIKEDESSFTITPPTNKQLKRCYGEVIYLITDNEFEVSPLADKESCCKTSVIKREKL